MYNLHNKTVTVIGVGALGSVISTQLVRLGVGEIRLVDRDVVEISNLQRQMLFNEQDAQEQAPKAMAAADRLKKMNSKVTLLPFIEDVNPHTIEDLVLGSDVILDGTDNFETRFLINDISIKKQIPWVYGGGVHSRGMTTAFIPGRTPCLRCLFDQPADGHGQTCDTIGVLGPLLHIIASYQVTAAYQILRGETELPNPQLRQVDIWYNDIDVMPIAQSINPDCPCCQRKTFHFLETSETEPIMTHLCGRDSIQITPVKTMAVDFAAWKAKWDKIGTVEQTPFLLRLSYQRYRLILFQDGRLLIQGTADPQKARQLYAQLIGV